MSGRSGGRAGSVGVERWAPGEPEGDPQKLEDAYATVAHSVSLAMAKELDCENDGGLEARPSPDPA
ncbi:hypothetical protein [Streptomyces sp. NPDC088180]|uniref:hypothetical protein n=1 Tax=Streptomyces sp. NPDC088180 TaxID=3365837 RepID=UPI00380C7F3E